MSVWNQFKCEEDLSISCLGYKFLVQVFKSLVVIWNFKSTPLCMFVIFCVYTILLRFLMQVFCVVTWIMCVWVLLWTRVLICWRWVIVWIIKSWFNLVVLYMFFLKKTLFFVLVLHMELVVFGKLCLNVMWHVDILFCVSCCVGKFKISLGIEP